MSKVFNSTIFASFDAFFLRKEENEQFRGHLLSVGLANMTDFDVIYPPGRGKIQITASKEVMFIREQMRIYFL